MAFHPFSVTIPHVAYACLGGFVVLFGMFSLFIREKMYIGEACWAFVFGVIIGPYGANIFNPRGWAGESREDINVITIEVTRVILAIGVFSIGVELPKAYMAKHWKSLFFLLVPVMTWGWFVSAGLIFALIPALDFLSSLVVAACLTPTDPILAAAVVGGKYADKHVPAHLRHLLAAESACNDGAAFPFLYIGLYLVLNASNSKAVENWFLVTWLYQVVFGTVLGSIIGFSFRHLMKFCERKDLIDRQSYVAQYVSLALFTIGVTTMLGSDDLLASFACGTAFAWDGFFNKQTEQSVFSSVIDLLFNVAAFVFLGAWMPFNLFTDAQLTLSVWRLVIIAILVILLRRLPIMVALYKWIPDVKTFREAVFSGHFGPMGVGAIFISTLAAEALPDPESPPANQIQLLAASIQPIVAFMVLCSIAVHGLSIPFFSLSRRVHSVSRTWSRHTSMEVSGPEWTTHTRRVTRAEDIVINRDSVMERGEALTVDEEGREKVVSDANGEKVADETKDKPMEGADERAHPDSPPDGSDIEKEWREGPHKVVERRAGPGEEVEVEVVRNAFLEEENNSSKVFRGEEPGVRHAVTQYMDKLKNASLAVEDGLRADVENLERGLEHGADKAREMGRRAKKAMSPTPEDEDDGWDSERSIHDQSVGPSTSARKADTSSNPPASIKSQHNQSPKRSKSPKQRSGSRGTVFVQGGGSHPRRRQSLRTRFLGRPQGHSSTLVSVLPPSSSVESVQDSPLRESDGEGEEREGRGRRLPPSRIASLRNLELAHMSRDVSPARSVRWADEQGSGASTPRSPLSPHHTPEEELAGDEGAQPGSRVMFHLPESGKR